MKSWILFSLLLVFGALCSNAQVSKSDGIYVTGTITGLNAVAECQGSNGRILVQVELYMQFRNSGDKPLIIFNKDKVFGRGLGLGSTRIVFLRGFPSKIDKERERIPINEPLPVDCYESAYNRTRYDPFPDFIKGLDRPRPTSEFLVIEPRSYQEFREVVTVDTGYKLDVQIGKSLKEAQLRSEYPAFQVEYHLSLKAYENGEGLLKSLQSRWKSFGDLVLDNNGDFTVISEPIINKSSE